MSMNILKLFQSFRTTLCICPCCGRLLRLSDLHLKYKGKVPRTWLDRYDFRLGRIGKQEAKFDEKENKLRQAAHERAKKKVPKLICKCIDRSIARLNFDPYDIKTLLHPVDFVVFNGLNANRELDDIIFLSKSTRNQALRRIRKSLIEAVDEERYDWKIARVSLDGTIQMEQ